MTGTDDTMGTTGTPGQDGAAQTTDTDQPAGTGAEAAPATADDPGLPYDRRPTPDGPVHRAPGYSTGDTDR